LAPSSTVRETRSGRTRADKSQHPSEERLIVLASSSPGDGVLS